MTAIDTKYAELGGESGFLGAPQTEEIVAEDGIGHYRHYSGGSIFWWPPSGAYEVHGPIRDHWAGLGWERSLLAYPITDEIAVVDGAGRMNAFQNGSILWSSSTGAHELHGSILSRWAAFGSTQSEFGYPVSDQTSTPDSTAQYNVFEHGVIYRIESPDVREGQTDYPYIRFQPGDKVWVDAGGCCQTGGTGATWKRYLDPQGPASADLYHGLMWVPGAMPALERIQGLQNHPLGVPSVPDPPNMFLRLGYEDDDYGDNGYWGRDNGTGDQCANQPNAWVMVMIVHGGIVPPPDPPADLDLVWQTTDDNLIPLNPEWGAQTRGQVPTPPVFQLVNVENPQSGVILDGLTTQPVTVDSSNGWNAIICGWGAGLSNSGALHGHLNWFATTYTGTIRWDNHSEWYKDDDYNMSFYPDGGAGLTTVNGDHLHIEFDSDETVDHFGSKWWQQFKDAVDNDVPTVRAIMDGSRAIVTGLFGLDIEHSSKAEIHPVWALAMRTGDYPDDETWAIFVRNWGDEGYCSQNQHFLYLLENRFTFRLPWRHDYYGVEVLPTSGFATNDTQHVSGPSVTPLADRSGVLVTFGFPDPEARALVDGVLRLRWTDKRPFDPPGPVWPPPAILGDGAPEELRLQPRADRFGGEGRVEALVRQLPAADQANLQEQLERAGRPYSGGPAKPSRPLESARQRLGPESTAAPVLRSVFDPAKAARDQRCEDCLRQAFKGRLPALVAAANRDDPKEFALSLDSLEHLPSPPPPTVVHGGAQNARER